MKNKLELILLICILVLGLIVRIGLITNTKTCANGCYSTHLKAALHYRDVNTYFSHPECQWFDQSVLFDSFFKLEGGFNLAKLQDELGASNHPPLYYYIVHLLHSFSADVEMAYNLAYFLNVVFALINSVTFCLILGHTRIPTVNKLVGTLWYSISLGFVQMTLLHKSYEMQLMFSQMLVLLVLSDLNLQKIGWRKILIYFLICALLYLSHYFSYVFVLAIGIWILLINLRTRNYLKIAQYGFASIFASFLAVSIYPSTIKDIFGEGYSGGITTRFIDIEWLLPSNVLSAIQLISHDLLTWPLILGCLMILTISLLSKGNVGAQLRSMNSLLLLGLISSIFFVVVVICSPGLKYWYGYLYTPYLLILIILFCSLSHRLSARIVLLVCTLAYSYLIFERAFYSDRKHIKSYSDSPLFENYQGVEGVVFVTKYGEYMRPFIYHNPYPKIAIVYEEFCPDIFENIPKTIFYVNSSDRRHQHSPLRDEILDYITKRGFILSDKSNQFDVYSIE